MTTEILKGEMLSMEQLDAVAGGVTRESGFDYFLLVEYELMDKSIIFSGSDRCLNRY